jgi:hypothetical protein
MPDDLLPPAPTPLPADRPRKLTCEFCECQLAPNGDVMSVSDRAKTYRDLKDKLDALKADLEAARANCTKADTRVRELEAKQKESIFS